MKIDTIEQLPAVLACDCGNTAIKLGVITGEKVTDVHSFPLGNLNELSSAVEKLWEQMPAPKRIAACSVNAAALKALEAAVSEVTAQAILVVGRDLPLPMPTEVDDPKAVGTDRVCAAVAAFDQLGTPCVVADFGSAITIDLVNEAGVFLGGAIFPGLAMSLAALADNTDQLPTLATAQPDWVVGKSTEQAMIGGVVFAARGALRDRIEAYATELGSWPTVILTGGDADLVCPHPGEEGLVQAIVSDLILRGVAIAYYHSLLPEG